MKVRAMKMAISAGTTDTLMRHGIIRSRTYLTFDSLSALHIIEKRITIRRRKEESQGVL